MENCSLRTLTGEEHHEFIHIFDELEEDYFPCSIYEDDDADVIEAAKCHRTQKTYVKSICKFCGKVI